MCIMKRVIITVLLGLSLFGCSFSEVESEPKNVVVQSLTDPCEPGATACEDSSLRTCLSNGTWSDPIACPSPEDPNLHQVGACLSNTCTVQCATNYDDCEPSQNGCESNLQITANHCGSCSRDCLDGPCSSAICQPVELTSGAWAIHRLALDESYIYWTEPLYTTGTVVRMPKSGGSPTILADGQPNARWITIANNKLYWTTTNIVNGFYKGSVQSMAMEGGTVTTIISGVNSLGGYANPVAIGANYVYWLDNYNIRKAPLTGGSTTTIWYGGYPSGFIASIVATPTYVYWGISDPVDSVKRAAVSNGVVSDVATNQENPYTLFVLDPYLYRVNTGTGYPYNGNISRTNMNTLVSETITTNETTPVQITSDGVYAYWTSGSGGSILRKAPVTGGSVETVTVSANGVRANIVVDGPYLYWTVNEQVVRVAK